MSQRSQIMCIVTLLLSCLAGTLAWAAAPTITAITPPSAVVGTVITITGTDLGAVTAVTFNGIATTTITENTATALKVTVPEGAISGKLMVTTAGGTVTNSYDFIVLYGLMNNPKDNAEMVWVPGSTFIMGRQTIGDSYDKPAHKVTLSGYWIYQYDVTVAQYRAFCTTTKHALPPWPQIQYSWIGTGWKAPALQQHPIVNVGWDDAKAYADWAGVTLPTEAQWEFAASGPLRRNYPWGGVVTAGNPYNGWDETKCANNTNSRNVGKSTWPVGSFPAGTSWCGAQDLAGNVTQWCEDLFDYYPDPTVTYPIKPHNGSRVIRGSSWMLNNDIYSTHRAFYFPNSGSYSIGFRCCSSLPGPNGAETLPRAAVPTITTVTPPRASVGTVITITGTDLAATIEVTFNSISAKNIIDCTTTTLTVAIPGGATSGKISVSTDGGTVTTDYTVIPATDGAAMVWVPGGTFTMGSIAGVGNSDEHPAHPVTLSGFWIYEYHVTVAQYLAFCAATGHALPPWPGDRNSWKGKTDWQDPALQQHPIINVTWNDAKSYADWVGMKLPTEAQWEYAARGPEGRNYPWGGTATKDSRSNGWDAKKCINRSNLDRIRDSTMPVGRFPAGASWCGAQDMAGNVWQWCSDRYGAYTATATTDPAGPATGKWRVLRGGAWLNLDSGRSTDRNGDDPDICKLNIGFRCVSP